MDTLTRAYLHSRRGEDRTAVHRRLVDTAAGLLPASSNEERALRS